MYDGRPAVIWYHIFTLRISPRQRSNKVPLYFLTLLMIHYQDHYGCQRNLSLSFAGCEVNKLPWELTLSQRRRAFNSVLRQQRLCSSVVATSKRSNRISPPMTLFIKLESLIASPLKMHWYLPVNPQIVKQQLGRDFYSDTRWGSTEGIPNTGLSYGTWDWDRKSVV